MCLLQAWSWQQGKMLKHIYITLPRNKLNSVWDQICEYILYADHFLQLLSASLLFHEFGLCHFPTCALFIMNTQLDISTISAYKFFTLKYIKHCLVTQVFCFNTLGIRNLTFALFFYVSKYISLYQDTEAFC